MGKASLKMYYDVVSPYAYMGVEVLKRYEKVWGDRVKVEYTPFFLGGIMAGSKNRPPISVPAKGLYMQKDLARSTRLMGLPNFRQPTIFPIQSYKQMRIVLALNDAEDRGEIDRDIVFKVIDRLWMALWAEDKNTSEESVIQSELDPILPGGWEKWKYAISDPAIKKRLTEITQETLDHGCFGAPWIEVTNAEGQTDRFFGSDRWDHVCDFLGEEHLGYCPDKRQEARL